MRRLRLIPDQTHVPFMRWRIIAFALTIALTAASLGSVLVQGLNLGLDFTGGILVEVKAHSPFELDVLRARLDALRLGEVTLQTFGDEQDLLIRVQEQPGGAAAQAAATEAVKAELGDGFEIRRTEFVGPQVSDELLRKGVLASSLAILLIAVYVYFRFEWQFAVAAFATTLHDVIATFGLFSIFQLEFNLTVVAAVLTIAGYSINDTIVVFDRIRENIRLYKTMDLGELIDLSINQTLTRTTMTSVTTLLAVLALLMFGGPVLRNFSVAVTWGLVIGTYSSVFVAAAMLLYMRDPRPARRSQPAPAAATETEGRSPAPPAMAAAEKVASSEP